MLPFLRRKFPQPQGGVRASRDDMPVIRRYGDGGDAFVMPALERANLLPGGDVPNLQRRALASGDRKRAVG